jgi:ankyrin repeat protein
VVNTPDGPEEGRLEGKIIDQINADDVDAVRDWLRDIRYHIEDTELGKKQTALSVAIRNGQQAVTKLLIDAGANPNSKMSGGATPLYIAAQEAQLQAIQLLIEAGAEIDAPMDNGASPLFVAALSNNKTCVQTLIKLGANVNSCTQTGATPLSMARSSKYQDIVELLEKAGAQEMNGGGGVGTGSSPAARRQLPSMSQKGLEVAVESWTASGGGGFLSQSKVVHTYHVSVKMFGRRWRVQKRFSEFKSLHERLRPEAALASATLIGRTGSLVTGVGGAVAFGLGGASGAAATIGGAITFPSSTVPSYMMTEAMLEQRRQQLHDFLVAIVANLKSLGGDVLKEWEEVIYEFFEVRKHVSEALLEVHAASAETGDEKARMQKAGWNAMSMAAQAGQRDNVDLMIKSGADVQQLNPDSSTALHIAAQEGHADCVQLLIDGKGGPGSGSGVDPNLRKKDGCTALWLACLNGHAEVVQVLIDNGADVDQCAEDGTSPMSMAAWKGNNQCINLLIVANAKVMSEDKKGDTALHVASQNGYGLTVKMLIEGKANVNWPNRVGDTPLCNAASNGRDDVLGILIKNGADITPAGNGHYAIYAAARHGHANCLQQLIAAGANVRTGVTMGRDGSTALHAAARNGHRDCLSVLVTAGAMVNDQDSDGTTALWLASRYGHEGTVRLLLTCGVIDSIRVGVEGGDSSHAQCGFTAGDAAVSYNHQGCMAILMAAGATAPCKLPMSLLNKRIDVEGMGQGIAYTIHYTIHHTKHHPLIDHALMHSYAMHSYTHTPYTNTHPKGELLILTAPCR